MSDDPTTSSQGRKRRRWGRWVLLVLALVVGGALVAPSVLSNRAERQIRLRIEQYRAAGEPVEPADLATPAIVDEENAVIELREAAQLINNYSRSSSNWKKYEQGSEDGYPSGWKERPFAAASRAENAEVFRLLDMAMAKDAFYWPNQPTEPVISWLLPDLSPQRQLAAFLGVAVLADHAAGDDATAVQDVRRLLFVGRGMDHHPQCLVVALVATSIREVACERLEKIAPDLKIGREPKAASPEAVAEVIRELLGEAEADETFRRAMLSERVISLDSTGAMFAGRLSPAAVASPGQGSAALSFAGSPVGRYVTGPFVRADLILILDAVTQMAEAMKAADWPTADAQVKHLRDAVMAEPKRHFWAALFLPSVDRAIETAYRSRTDRRLAALVLATRWYAAEHDGRLPATLDELVPKYLPGVPRDPFVAGGRAALRYVAAGPDPRVYSVGRDGVDDGGSDQPTGGNAKRGDRWAGKDAVAHLRRQERRD